MNMTYASERFIVALGRNPKPQAGERSDNEIALFRQCRLQRQQGSKLDSAMNARTAFLFASIFPVMPLVNAVIGRPVMNAMIDQKEIDALAFRCLKNQDSMQKQGLPPTSCVVAMLAESPGLPSGRIDGRAECATLVS